MVRECKTEISFGCRLLSRWSPITGSPDSENGWTRTVGARALVGEAYRFHCAMHAYVSDIQVTMFFLDLFM